jgi:general stress protein 26
MSDATENTRLQRIVTKAIAKNAFATLATSSAANRPHVAGIAYAEAGGDLYVSTMESSIKARNIAANPRVAVTIPVRRLPFFPPSTIQFQGSAEIIPSNDPRIAALIEGGELKQVTSHGEVDLPGGCFLKITPTRRIVTFGLGMSLLALIRNPLAAGRTVQFS